MKHPASRRGFSLIELLIASAIAVAVIAAAISVGVQLQRRGFLEERTMVTQNAARAARDLIDSSVQRAGAGAGTAPLVVSATATNKPDYRYAVRVDTNSQGLASDSTFHQPTGRYANLQSDALEIWETDPGQMVSLIQCTSLLDSAWSALTGRLCLGKPLPTELKNKPVAIFSLRSTDNGTRPFGCFGVLGGNPQPANAFYPPTIDWTPGIPGRPPPTSDVCGQAPTTGSTLWGSDDLFLMPLTARAFRVNWNSDTPSLEMDPDGFAGDAGYVEVSQEIERLKVRVGVVPALTAGANVLYFPDTDAGRPALDTCTNSTCDDFITWDAGSLATEDRGPGSAQDRLMERARMVEMLITARSQRLDRLADLPLDGGVDEDGNIQDGFKRRHSVVRLSPRNFLFEGY